MPSILQQLLGGLGAPAAERYKNVFTKDFDHDDLWDSALETDTVNHEITATAGIWTVIGRYQVKAQQQVRWGYGSAAFPVNQGTGTFGSSQIDGDGCFLHLINKREYNRGDKCPGNYSA